MKTQYKQPISSNKINILFLLSSSAQFIGDKNKNDRVDASVVRTHSIYDWCLFATIIIILTFYILYQIVSGSLTECPGYDGITYRLEAEKICAIMKN